MQSRTPFVTVIVPVWNDAERLGECLHALEGQTYPTYLFEVVVVDNGSEESVAPLVARYGRARLVRARIGALYKVLPTAVFAAAMRPSIGRRDLEGRIDRLLEELSARHANLGVSSGRQAVEEAAEPLETRGIIVAERGRFRVRERSVLRYYGRTIEHLLVTAGRTH